MIDVLNTLKLYIYISDDLDVLSMISTSRVYVNLERVFTSANEIILKPHQRTNTVTNWPEFRKKQVYAVNLMDIQQINGR